MRIACAAYARPVLMQPSWSAMRFKHSKAIELSLRCQPDSLVRDGRPVLAPSPLSGLGRVLHQFRLSRPLYLLAPLSPFSHVSEYSEKVETVARRGIGKMARPSRGGEGRVETLSARCAEGSRTWWPRHVGRYAAGLTGPYAEIVKYT